MQSTQIRLAARPVGEPDASTFETVTVDLPEVGEGQVRLRTIYLSLDPYMRGRMSTAKSYAEPLEIGDVMLGGTVCEVEESRDEAFPVGSVVLAFTGWQTQAVVPTTGLRIIDTSTLPPSTALGVLGMPGFTAYAGLLEIGKPQAGETVVVAAATGPVGSAVGQIAKVKGARAVGIAGGAEKCRALIEEFGFDAAVDHRSPTFADDLVAACPDGIDVYFENVGGAVLDAVVPLLNKYARVPVCGLVANYNATSLPDGPDRFGWFMGQVLRRSLTVRGFIQDEFSRSHGRDFFRDMSAWVADGSVRYREDVAAGLESAPEAFVGMLRGKNFGKQLVRVGADPAA
ncbi:MAG: NADP-dependent oxidoreductase [Nocardioidaceae bacterium]